jgi:hypothetical protein
MSAVDSATINFGHKGFYQPPTANGEAPPKGNHPLEARGGVMAHRAFCFDFQHWCWPSKIMLGLSLARRLDPLDQSFLTMLFSIKLHWRLGGKARAEFAQKHKLTQPICGQRSPPDEFNHLFVYHLTM